LSNAKKNLIRISDHENEKDFGYVYGVSGPGMHNPLFAIA
jgi:V-type H+-transporting ATPase subunit A